MTTLEKVKKKIDDLNRMTESKLRAFVNKHKDKIYSYSKKKGEPDQYYFTRWGTLQFFYPSYLKISKLSENYKLVISQLIFNHNFAQSIILQLKKENKILIGKYLDYDGKLLMEKRVVLNEEKKSPDLEFYFYYSDNKIKYVVEQAELN